MSNQGYTRAPATPPFQPSPRTPQSAAEQQREATEKIRRALEERTDKLSDTGYTHERIEENAFQLRSGAASLAERKQQEAMDWSWCFCCFGGNTMGQEEYDDVPD